MKQFADKNPVITCYETYLETDKKVKLDYTQIKEIHQEVRVRGKSYETFLFINHQLGMLRFNETNMESGYGELKHLLENIPSASHITFTSEQVDERWLSRKSTASRPRSSHIAKDPFSKIDKGEKAYEYY